MHRMYEHLTGDALVTFSDDQDEFGGNGASSEHAREIRMNRDRQQLRRLLLEGANSPPALPADRPYFERLRARARRAE